MKRGALTLAIFVPLLGLVVGPTDARASTGYPAEMQRFLPLSFTPACSLCHGTDVDAGTGNATKFGKDIIVYGLAGNDNLPLLDGALEGMVGSQDPLIFDLEDGSDPNGATTPSDGGTSNTIPPITYGCFNVTGQGRTPGFGGLLVVGLALIFLLRPWAFRRVSSGDNAPKP
jgi:hypothetical protein